MEHVLLAPVVSKTMTPAPLLFQHLWVFFPEPSLCTHKKVLDSDDGRMLYPSTTLLAFSLSGHSHICGWHHCPRENIDMSQKNEYMLDRISCSLLLNNMSLQLSTYPSHGFPGYSVTKGRLSLRFASSRVKMRKWEEFEEARLCVPHLKEWASQMMLVVNNFACWCRRCKRHRFDTWVGKIPWRRTWQPTPVFLPGEAHGQRSLVDYCPCGHKEVSDWAT